MDTIPPLPNNCILGMIVAVISNTNVIYDVYDV